MSDDEATSLRLLFVGGGFFKGTGFLGAGFLDNECGMRALFISFFDECKGAGNKAVSPDFD